MDLLRCWSPSLSTYDAHAALFVFATVLMMGCGARTALEELGDADARDSSMDDAGAPDAPSERCDGRDNDDDGRVDEGLPTVECGIGACRRSACSALRCVPGVPLLERCGGGDDDCDGSTDEGLLLGALGPAVEVREGVGGYDRCSTCSWAQSPILVALEDGGVFVQWHHGIYGGDEIPNMWGRVLGENGLPIDEPQQMGGLVQLSARRIPGHEVDDGLIFAVERIGVRDVGRLWRIADGRVEQQEADFDSCSAGTTVASIDGRIVSACLGRGAATLRSQRAGEPTNTIRLDVDDMFYGAVLHTRPVDGELMLAAYHVDVDRDQRWMSFGRLSPTLELLQPLTRSDAAYTRGEVAFPTPEGWLWWILGRDGVRAQRLDASGRLLGPAEPYPFGVTNPPLASVSLDDGHHLIAIPAGSFDDPFALVRIDERGTLMSQLDVEIPPNPAGDPDFAAHVDLIEHGDVFWAAWIGSYAVDGEPNFVHVQRFGCVAP